MASPDRPGFTLPAASALRARAARVTERGDRRGAPRHRFLAARRREVALRLLSALAVLAVVAGASAATDLLLARDAFPRPAVAFEAVVAAALAALALAVPFARRSLLGIVGLGVASATVALVGWGLVARASGRGESPYLFVLPLGVAAFTGFVPLPPRATLAVAAVGYASLLLAGPRAPLLAHLLVIVAGLAGYAVARTRRREGLRELLRVERSAAAIVRLRRVQEQLVVVEKLEALRVMVGGMAHELNNALAVASASSQSAARLAQRGDAEGAAQALQRGDGGLARIRRSVDRLRRFAMAAEGTLEPADVAALLDFALESAIGRARSGVVVERAYDPAVGTIDCHVAALAEALFQVARNAVEAMPGGGRIHASVRAEAGGVVLAVRDEGRGIPAEELARVFDPFWSRVATRGGGRRSAADKAGLGLSAVYGLVSALGGSVEVRSQVGLGTEIAIRMPTKR